MQNAVVFKARYLCVEIIESALDNFVQFEPQNRFRLISLERPLLKMPLTSGKI